MAARADAIRLTRWGSVGPGATSGVSKLALIFLLLASNLVAQTLTPLSELNHRTGSDRAPALAGQKVTVRGVVSARAFHVALNYTALAIQGPESGAALRSAASDTTFDGFLPGDEVVAHGTVVTQYGMPMVQID